MLCRISKACIHLAIRHIQFIRFVRLYLLFFFHHPRRRRYCLSFMLSGQYFDRNILANNSSNWWMPADAYCAVPKAFIFYRKLKWTQFFCYVIRLLFFCCWWLSKGSAKQINHVEANRRRRGMTSFNIEYRFRLIRLARIQFLLNPTCWLILSDVKLLQPFICGFPRNFFWIVELVKLVWSLIIKYWTFWFKNSRRIDFYFCLRFIR